MRVDRPYDIRRAITFCVRWLAPILVAEDTSGIVSRVDAIAVVLRFIVSSVRLSHRAIARIKERQGNVVGLVLNEISASLPEYNSGGVQGYPKAGAFSGWWSADGAHSMISTIIPINYPVSDSDTTWCGSASAGPAHSMFNNNISWGFRSRHPGGANFTFVDGSVHFLSQSIDHKTFQFLGCKSDGQVVGDYNN